MSAAASDQVRVFRNALISIVSTLPCISPSPRLGPLELGLRLDNI